MTPTTPPPKIGSKDERVLAATAALQRGLAQRAAAVDPPPRGVDREELPELAADSVRAAMVGSRIDDIEDLPAVPSPAIRQIIADEKWLDDAGDVHYRVTKLGEHGLIEKYDRLPDDLHSHSRMSGLVLTERGWQLVEESSVGIWGESPSATVEELRDELAALGEELATEREARRQLESQLNGDETTLDLVYRRQLALAAYLRGLDFLLFLDQDSPLDAGKSPSSPWNSWQDFDPDN